MLGPSPMPVVTSPLTTDQAYLPPDSGENTNAGTSAVAATDPDHPTPPQQTERPGSLKKKILKRSRRSNRPGGFIGSDHDRSTKSGILGIGSTPLNKWSIRRHAQSNVYMDRPCDEGGGMTQDEKSEKLYDMIMRYIRHWEEEYPPSFWEKCAEPYLWGEEDIWMEWEKKTEVAKPVSTETNQPCFG